MWSIIYIGTVIYLSIPTVASGNQGVRRGVGIIGGGPLDGRGASDETGRGVDAHATGDRINSERNEVEAEVEGEAGEADELEGGDDELDCLARRHHLVHHETPAEVNALREMELLKHAHARMFGLVVSWLAMASVFVALLYLEGGGQINIAHLSDDEQREAGQFVSHPNVARHFRRLLTPPPPTPPPANWDPLFWPGLYLMLPICVAVVVTYTIPLCPLQKPSHEVLRNDNSSVWQNAWLECKHGWPEYIRLVYAFCIGWSFFVSATVVRFWLQFCWGWWCTDYGDDHEYYDNGNITYNDSFIASQAAGLLINAVLGQTDEDHDDGEHDDSGEEYDDEEGGKKYVHEFFTVSPTGDEVPPVPPVCIPSH